MADHCPALRTNAADPGTTVQAGRVVLVARRRHQDRGIIGIRVPAVLRDRTRGRRLRRTAVPAPTVRRLRRTGVLVPTVLPRGRVHLALPELG